MKITYGDNEEITIELCKGLAVVGDGKQLTLNGKPILTGETKLRWEFNPYTAGEIRDVVDYHFDMGAGIIREGRVCGSWGVWSDMTSDDYETLLKQHRLTMATEVY